MSNRMDLSEGKLVYWLNEKKYSPGCRIKYKNIHRIQEKPCTGWIDYSQNQFNSSLRKKKQVKWRESKQNVLTFRRDAGSETEDIH